MLHHSRGCFETRPLGAPQHEVVLDGIKTSLIRRRPWSGRLEGRALLLQP
jgi:hypothetical protein